MLNEELKRLISANKISEAISIMTEILNGKDEEMSNALVLLSGRLTAGERSHLAGLIKFEEFQSLIISISNAALNYIDSATNDGYFADIPDMKSLKEKRVEGKKTKLLFVGSLPKDLSLDFQIEKEYLEIVGAKSKEKEEDVPFKMPYVLFINGVSDDPIDTTLDDFPCETTATKSKTKG